MVVGPPVALGCVRLERTCKELDAIADTAVGRKRRMPDDAF
jgi:hypothetical protein